VPWPLDEPLLDEPLLDEPLLDEPLLDEPLLDEPLLDEPLPLDEPPLDDPPLLDEPPLDEPPVEGTPPDPAPELELDDAVAPTVTDALAGNPSAAVPCTDVSETRKSLPRAVPECNGTSIVLVEKSPAAHVSVPDRGR
jgi:hypothetical protein